LARGAKLKLIFFGLHSAISKNQNSRARFALKLGKHLPLAVEQEERRSRCHTYPNFFHTSGENRRL
jgi:hypothetical protein